MTSRTRASGPEPTTLTLSASRGSTGTPATRGDDASCSAPPSISGPTSSSTRPSATANSTDTRPSACTSASAIVSATSNRSETRSSESPARAPTMPKTRASTGPAATAETTIRDGTVVCTALRTAIAVTVAIGVVLREGHRDLGSNTARAGPHLHRTRQRCDQRQSQAEPGGPREDAHPAAMVADGDVEVLAVRLRLDLELCRGRLGRIRVHDDVGTRLGHGEAHVVRGAGRKAEPFAQARDRLACHDHVLRRRRQQQQQIRHAFTPAAAAATASASDGWIANTGMRPVTSKMRRTGAPSSPGRIRAYPRSASRARRSPPSSTASTDESMNVAPERSITSGSACSIAPCTCSRRAGAVNTSCSPWTRTRTTPSRRSRMMGSALNGSLRRACRSAYVPLYPTDHPSKPQSALRWTSLDATDTALRKYLRSRAAGALAP